MLSDFSPCAKHRPPVPAPMIVTLRGVFIMPPGRGKLLAKNANRGSRGGLRSDRSDFRLQCCTLRPQFQLRPAQQNERACTMIIGTMKLFIFPAGPHQEATTRTIRFTSLPAD